MVYHHVLGVFDLGGGIAVYRIVYWEYLISRAGVVVILGNIRGQDKGAGSRASRLGCVRGICSQGPWFIPASIKLKKMVATPTSRAYHKS